MAIHLGSQGDDGDLDATINTTPLVDVMLVLLIIFLITVPVAIHTVPVALPKQAARVNITRPKTVTVAVTKDGTVYWNERRIDGAEGLDDLLREAAAQAPPPDVDIRGDGDVAYGSVGKVVAAIRKAGLPDVAFVTEPPRAGGSVQ
jgi:biopolymer transport protein ExbD